MVTALERPTITSPSLANPGLNTPMTRDPIRIVDPFFLHHSTHTLILSNQQRHRNLLLATRSHLSSVCRIRQSSTAGQESEACPTPILLEVSKNADLRISLWTMREAV